MTRAIKASEIGLKSHYKVRIVFNGSVIHAASWTKPKIEHYGDREGPLVTGAWIDDPDYGDTIGYIDWNTVSAITWRWSE